MSRPRRKQVARPSKTTILIVTNGEITELQYLNRIAARARRLDKSLEIKVKAIPGAPLTVVRKLESPQGDVSGYDEVWIVVDEDDFDAGAFLDACNRHRSSHWVPIINRPCFETWLVAHYEPVSRHVSQEDAKAQLARITNRRPNEKDLPADFPFDAVGLAVRQCRLSGAEEEATGVLPPKPGSGMGHLLRRLGVVT